MTGKGARPPFHGNCNNCGLIGHSAANSPDLGKGFKGSCKGCGIRGHVVAQCPKGTGKGLNNLEGDEQEGLNFGGKEEEERGEEEEDKNTKTEKEWNAKSQAAADWESWQNDNYGMYWVGKRETQ